MLDEHEADPDRSGWTLPPGVTFEAVEDLTLYVMAEDDWNLYAWADIATRGRLGIQVGSASPTSGEESADIRGGPACWYHPAGRAAAAAPGPTDGGGVPQCCLPAEHLRQQQRGRGYRCRRRLCPYPGETHTPRPRPCPHQAATGGARDAQPEANLQMNLLNLGSDVESVVVGVVGGLHKARAAAPRYVVVASLGTRYQVLCRVKAMTPGLGELDAYGGNSSIAFADITATGRLVGRFANCTTSRQIEWFLRQMRLNGGIPPRSTLKFLLIG